MSIVETKLEAKLEASIDQSTLDEEAELAAQASIKIVKKYVSENGEPVDPMHEPMEDDDEDESEEDDMLEDDEDHENLNHENKDVLERSGNENEKLRRRLPMSIKELIDYHSSNGKSIKEIVNRINMVCRADEKVSYGVSFLVDFLLKLLFFSVVLWTFSKCGFTWLYSMYKSICIGRSWRRQQPRRHAITGRNMVS